MDKKLNNVKKFFSSYLFIGIIITLIGIIVEVLSSDLHGKIVILTEIFSKSATTVGVGLIVGYIMDLTQKTKDFTDYIKNIIQDVVVSKEFIKDLSNKSKNLILKNAIIADQNVELSTTVLAYLNKTINQTLNFFNYNFRNNFKLEVNVKKENNIYIAKYFMQYKIFKTNNKYQPIYIHFEKDSEITKTVIKTSDGKEREIKKSDYDIDEIPNIKRHKFEIPQDFLEAEYLIIERHLIEKGHDHWLSINWTALTPIDGIYFTVNCKDGIVKEYNIFDNSSLYDCKLSDDKKTLYINANQWSDPYTGICVIVGDETTN